MYSICCVRKKKYFSYACTIGLNISSMQVDLQQIKYVVKIATQCRGDHTECVSSYYVKVASSAADDDYTAVCGMEGCPQLYTGNEDTSELDAVVYNEFDWPIAARFVRLNPQSWNMHIAVRWEIYGCDNVC